MLNDEHVPGISFMIPCMSTKQVLCLSFVDRLGVNYSCYVHRHVGFIISCLVRTRIQALLCGHYGYNSSRVMALTLHASPLSFMSLFSSLSPFWLPQLPHVTCFDFSFEHRLTKDIAYQTLGFIDGFLFNVYIDELKSRTPCGLHTISCRGQSSPPAQN